MKIECVKDRLEEVLKVAERATSKNTTLPILSCFRLEGKKGVLSVRATNLDLGIEVSLPTKVEKDGVVVIPATPLTTFISHLYADRSVKLELVSGNVRITTAGNQTTLKALPPDDFPAIPFITDVSPTPAVPAAAFAKGLKVVAGSASTGSVKPELGSVCVFLEGDTTVFAATDSFRLAEKKVSLPHQKEGYRLLIPVKNASEIIRTIEELPDEKFSFYITKHQISLSFHSVYLTSRLIEGLFPDYKQIIPKEFKTEAVVLKEDLSRALKISSIFTDKFNQLKFVITPKNRRFSIETRNADIGENTHQLPATLKGEPLEISFNWRYLTDALAGVETDSVTLGFNGQSKPLVVRGVGDQTFSYLVMPMNR